MRLPTLALATWLVTGFGSLSSVLAHPPLSLQLRSSGLRNQVVSPAEEAQDGSAAMPSISGGGMNEGDASSNILLSTTTSSIQARPTSNLPKPPTRPPTSPPPSSPQPFDTRMIANPNFVSCLPFSLLLTSSSAFNSRIQAATQSGNYTYLNNLLSYTGFPQPSGDACDTYMGDYLIDLRKKDNCGSDQSNTGVVTQARRGLGNYQVMRTAATLVHPDTGVYCYIDALASSRPDDLYLWKLPSGNILPPSSTPTCSPCSQLLMNHLTSSTDMSASLNTTIINNAATAINIKCGSQFVNLAQRTGADDSSNISNSASGTRVRPHIMVLVIAISSTWAFSF